MKFILSEIFHLKNLLDMIKTTRLYLLFKIYLLISKPQHLEAKLDHVFMDAGRYILLLPRLTTRLSRCGSCFIKCSQFL